MKQILSGRRRSGWCGKMPDMATPIEDFSDLHSRVLRFMGAFSTTQFAIDTVVTLFLRRRMPGLGPALETQFLARVRDDQRLPLFKGFVAEAAYEGDLSRFDQIYLRAKQTRDLVGHSQSVGGPVYRKNHPPTVSVVGANSVKRTRVPKPLVPSTFDRLTADCEWLTSHVWRAGYVAEPSMFLGLTGEPSEPPVPTTLPEGGEPL